MAVLAPPVQVVASGAPPFVQVPSGAPPFVVTTGPAPPIQIVASGAPPITLFNADGSIWSAHTPAGGELLLTGETDGFATDFLHPVDAERVALKSSGSTLAYAVDAFYQNAGTSPKMVYDVAGTLGWSPHNLLLQSQTFDNASWSKEQSTVTANATTAPDGTLTADKLIEDSSTGAHDVGQVYTAITGVVSVYAKAAERSFVMFYDYGSGNGDAFNLSTGVVLAAPGGGVSSTGGATIQSVGNGWYRCSMPITASTGVNIYTHNGTTYNYAGNGSSGIYIWGVQVNKGTVPLAYLPTTTAARFGLALDYDPVTHAARGLLCEPAATNLVVDSKNMTTGWTLIAGMTRTLAQGTAPNGANELIKFTMAAGSTAKQIWCPTGAAAVRPNSIYAKAGTLNWICVSAQGANTDGVYFNLATGVVGTQKGTSTGYMENCGNGIWRCVTVLQAGSFFTLTCHSADNQADTWNATGGETVFVWGAQCETGTVATSPIPTLAATVTRAGDRAFIEAASINYSATAGSWWVEHYTQLGQTSQWIIGTNTSAATPIFSSGDHFYGMDSDSSPIYSIIGSGATGNINRAAVAFQSGDRAISAKGLVPTTDAGATAAILAPLQIWFGFGSGGINMNGWIRKVRYLPRRPSNAELQAMTT